MRVSSHLSRRFCSGGPDVLCLARLSTKWPGCLALSVSLHSSVFVLAEFGQSDSDSLISCAGSHTIPPDHNEITQAHTHTHTHTHTHDPKMAQSLANTALIPKKR